MWMYSCDIYIRIVLQRNEDRIVCQGWDKRMDSMTSWKPNAMLWPLRFWITAMEVCMKTSRATMNRIWRNLATTSLRWLCQLLEKQHLLMMCHHLRLNHFFSQPFIYLRIPGCVARLTPQQFGSPTSRPRQYRLTWGEELAWKCEPFLWLDPFWIF